MSHGISLSKSMCLKIQDERDRMKEIPYASAIEIYHVCFVCIRPNISNALRVTSGYQRDPDKGCWVTVIVHS